MRKFVIRLAEGSDQRFMRPVHDTMNEAIQCIMDYVAKCNDRLQMNDPRRMSPFDFKVEKLVRELNPRHADALIALNELFTIAEAWNKADGFVPDFSDNDQQKYFPWFVYDKDVARFVPCVSMPSAYISALLGARLCFKTEERSMQFAQRFAGLFNKFLMLDRREEVSDGR